MNKSRILEKMQEIHRVKMFTLLIIVLVFVMLPRKG